MIQSTQPLNRIGLSDHQRGDLVRLLLTGDVFEVAGVLPGGMLKLSNPGLQLIANADGVEAVQGELDELPIGLSS